MLGTMRKSEMFDEEEALEELEEALRIGNRLVDPNHTVLTWVQNHFDSLFEYNLQFHSRNNKLELVCQQPVNFDDICYASCCWLAWWRLHDRKPAVRRLQRLAILNLLVVEKLTTSSIGDGLPESFEGGWHEGSLVEDLATLHKNRKALQEGKVKKMVLKMQKSEGTDAYRKSMVDDLRTLQNHDQDEIEMHRIMFSSRSGVTASLQLGVDIPSPLAAQDWFKGLLDKYGEKYPTWQALVAELKHSLGQLTDSSVDELRHINETINNLDHYESMQQYVLCSVAQTLHSVGIGGESIYGEQHMASMRDYDPHFQSRDLGATAHEEQFCTLDYISIGWCTDDLVARDHINVVNGYYQEEPAAQACLISLALQDGTLPVMDTPKKAQNFLMAAHEAVRMVEYGNYLTRGAYKLNRNIIYFAGHTGCQESQYETNWDFTPWFNNNAVFKQVMRKLREEVFGPPKEPRTLLEILGDDEADAETVALLGVTPL